MSSTKSILKSTSLIGAASVISIVFRIIKGKFIALILGPSGTGLIGALDSAIQLVQKIAGLGLENSAVRDIAKAKAGGNEIEISSTIRTLRYAIICTGILGTISAIIFSGVLSNFTFGSNEYVWEIRFLSIVVFFNLVRSGQSALLQGLREIKSLAKLTIWSSFMGAVISIPVLYFFEMDGVTVFLILLSLGQLIVSWYYARKVNVKNISLTLKEVWKNSQGMIKLGFAFMGGGFVTYGGTYLIRVILIRYYDLEVAGLYQAATTISTVYIGIILNAMGKDFYPRLAAVADKAKEEIRIINEQTEIGIYLAAPGLLFTLALAPFGIKLMYTSEYLDATLILQWMILGIFLRTIVWPMGYLFIARGKTIIFFLNQVFSTVIHLGAIILFLNWFGIEGAGIAFFVMYALYMIYMYLMAKRENNFKWNAQVIKLLFVLGALFTVSLIITINLNQIISGIIVSIIGLILSFYSIKKVMQILELHSFKELLLFIKGSKKKQ